MEQQQELRILITGGTGFVGGYLSAECERMFPQALIVKTHSGPQSAAVAQDDHCVVADVTSLPAMRALVADVRPDLVFHLAAQASVAASWQDPVRTLETNAQGCANLLEAVRTEELHPRIVLVGSGEEYGVVLEEDNPIEETMPLVPVTPYAVSKVTQSMLGFMYAQTFGLSLVRVRAFNHFGPGQSETYAIAHFARQIADAEMGRAEPTLRVGNLSARRDFLAVEDVVRAYLALAQHGQSGEAYNVGSGVARSMDSILQLLLSFARIPMKVELDERLVRPVEVPLLVASVEKLKRDTGWEPQEPFEHALQRTLDYWRQRQHDTSPDQGAQ